MSDISYDVLCDVYSETLTVFFIFAVYGRPINEICAKSSIVDYYIYRLINISKEWKSSFEEKIVDFNVFSDPPGQSVRHQSVMLYRNECGENE